METYIVILWLSQYSGPSQRQRQRQRRQTIHQGFVLALLDQQYPRIQHSAQQSNKHCRLFLEPEWPAHHSYSQRLQMVIIHLTHFPTKSQTHYERISRWERGEGMELAGDWITWKWWKCFFFSIMVQSARECLLALIIPKRSVERDQPH